MFLSNSNWSLHPTTQSINHKQVPGACKPSYSKITQIDARSQRPEQVLSSSVGSSWRGVYFLPSISIWKPYLEKNSGPSFTNSRYDLPTVGGNYRGNFRVPYGQTLPCSSMLTAGIGCGELSVACEYSLFLRLAVYLLPVYWLYVKFNARQSSLAKTTTS